MCAEQYSKSELLHFLLLTIEPANELLDWHRAGRLSNEALYKTTLPPSQAFPVPFNYLISKLR